MRSLIRAGTFDIWLVACQVTRRQPVHRVGEKERVKLLRELVVLVLWEVIFISVGHESRLSGAVGAPRTRPDPPQTRPTEYSSAVMQGGTARDATVEVSAGIRDGL